MDEDSCTLDQKKAEVTFRAKKGRLVDLDKLHESIRATRLSGGTGSWISWLDVTAVGTVVVDDEKTLLKVSGSEARFVLIDDPAAEAGSGKESAFRRLRQALDGGDRVVRVSGRVDGWKSHWPPFLAKLPAKPRRIIVKDFKTAGK